MSNFLEKTGAFVIASPFIAIVVAGTSAIIGIPHAWAARMLWGWYITPVSSIQPPSMLTFYGAALLISVLMPKHNGPKEKEFSAGQHIIAAILYPLIVVGLGWLARWLFA